MSLKTLVTQRITHYGYAGLFSLMMFGIVGIPIPDETLLTPAGLLVSRARLSAIPTVATATLGSTSGISCSYVIGRYLGTRFILKSSTRAFFLRASGVLPSQFLYPPNRLTNILGATLARRGGPGCGTDSPQPFRLEEVHLTDTTWVHAATVFMGFFAIMNPIANTPVFLALTEGDDDATKKRIAAYSLSLALILVALFSLTGNLIFDLFGITLHAFRITGGVLVFYIGVHMLHGEPSPVHNPSTEDNRKSQEAALSVAVAPLAVPILAGPGTLATAMSYTAAGTATDTLVTILCFAGLCGVSYGLFISGEHFIRYIGEGAVKVITRMMGLILAVIGVQMLIQGVQGAMG